MSPRSVDDHTHRGETQLLADAEIEADRDPARAPGPVISNADRAATAERLRSQRAEKSGEEAPARDPRQFVGDLPPPAPAREIRMVSAADGADVPDPPAAAPDDADATALPLGDTGAVASVIAAPAAEELAPPESASWLRRDT